MMYINIFPVLMNMGLLEYCTVLLLNDYAEKRHNNLPEIENS